jgi:hypothetical protein
MTTVFSHFYNDLLSTTGRKNWFFNLCSGK